MYIYDEPGKLELAETDLDSLNGWICCYCHLDPRSLFPDMGNVLACVQGLVSGCLYNRQDMPVVNSDEIPDFIRYCVGRGYGCQIKKIKARELKPVQRQIYLDKVFNKILINNDINKSYRQLASIDNCLLTDCCGNIIDGHHRWLEAMFINQEMELPCCVMNCDIDIALAIASIYSKLKRYRCNYNRARGNPRLKSWKRS